MNIVSPTQLQQNPKIPTGLQGLNAKISAQKKPAVPSAEATWPEPGLIRNALRPVQPLRPEMIPEPLRLWLTDEAYRMQVPLDYVATAALVMISSIIGAGCGILPKRLDGGWLVIPNLWGAVVARPGMLKTPALEAALRTPLKRLEAAAAADFDEAQARFDSEDKSFQARQAALKDELKRAAISEIKGKAHPGKTENLEAMQRELKAPEKPAHRRYITNDSTVQKMNVLQSENPRGILVFHDELTGFLVKLDKEGCEGDRSFHLKAWTGNGVNTDDTLARGTVRAPNLCESIFGGIQPSKLTEYFRQVMSDIGNDGLIQRFQMMVYPDEPNTWSLIDQSANTEQKNRAFAIIERLAQMDFTQHGAVMEDDETIPWLRFSDDAQPFFNSWLTKLQTEKLKRDDDAPIMQEHLSKYRSLMPSLALIFHLIEMADGKSTGPVTLRSSEQAAAWCEYLESHARRIYGMLQGVGRQTAILLASKIKDGALSNGFTARDVYLKDWSGLSDSKVVSAAIRELVEADWLSQVTPPTEHGKGGRPPLPSYNINPRVLKTK